MDDAEEEFDLEEVGCGENSGNPKPFAAPTPSSTDAVAEQTGTANAMNMSTISNTTLTPLKRHCQSKSTAIGELVEVVKLKMIADQHTAEERRVAEDGRCELEDGRQ